MRHLIATITLITLIAVLAGCAAPPLFESREEYSRTMRLIIGESEDTLISVIGPPDSVYMSGTRRYLTYRESTSGSMTLAPGGHVTTFENGALVTRDVPAKTFDYSRSCETTFVVIDLTVVDVTFRGRGCVM